jgi:hypothetical protein
MVDLEVVETALAVTAVAAEVATLVVVADTLPVAVDRGETQQ